MGRPYTSAGTQATAPTGNVMGRRAIGGSVTIAPAFLLFAIVACGPDVDPKGAELPEPWKAMNLPVGQGEVREVGPTALHVVYLDSSDSKQGMASRWSMALGRAGFEDVDQRAMGPLIGVDLVREGRPLQLIVAGNGNRLDVQLEFE